MDWSQTAAAGVSAFGGLMSNVATGLFNANQSAINRSFQREMYERQYKDSLDFWNLQNRYNLPSAQVQRMRDAGINPALLYSSGAPQNVATSAPQIPDKPSGAQTSAAFSNPLDLASYALLDAQREKTKAETEKTKAETDWQKIENQFSKDTYNVRYAIQHKNWEMLDVSLQQMRNDIVNSSMITSQQVQTMIQGRQMEIKRYHLDADYRGGMLQQGWKQLELDSARVSQGWRQLAIDAGRLVNETNMTNAQVGLLQWNLLSDKAMFGLRFNGLDLDNKLKMWDTHLRRATLNEKQVQTWNGVLKNYYLENTGTEQINNTMTQFPQLLWQGGNKPQFQDLFVVPRLKK